MKKITRRSMLKGSAVAAAALALSACGGSSSSSSSASSASAAASAAADGIGFPKNETITLAVPGKAGGGSDLAIRYYSEGLNRIYGLKTTVTNYDSNTVGHQDRRQRKAGRHHHDAGYLFTEHPVHHRQRYRKPHDRLHLDRLPAGQRLLYTGCSCKRTLR